MRLADGIARQVIDSGRNNGFLTFVNRAAKGSEGFLRNELGGFVFQFCVGRAAFNA
jgi:hypothetical protein